MPMSDEVDLTSFATAHRLKYLEYSDTRDRLSHGTQHPPTDWPWLSLTHFSGSLYRMDCIDPILFHFKNLVYIHLKWTDWRLSAGDPIPDTIHAMSCKHLHLEIHLPTYIWPRHNPTTFLTFVEFPSLEELAITYLANEWNDSENVLQLLAPFVQRHGKHLGSFHWNSSVNRYFNYGNEQYPPIVSGLNVERSIFDKLSSLKTLRITVPVRDTLEDLLRSLRLDRAFLPRLRRLDLRIKPDAMKHKDLTTLCELLRKFVRMNEMFPLASPARRDITIRLQVAKPTPIYPDSVSPWDIVVKLDEWEEKLHVDALPSTASGATQPLSSLDSTASSGPSSQPLEADLPRDLALSHQVKRYLCHTLPFIDLQSTPGN
ncbi:hypothetical protein P691DRAFT_506123 [Macrolepiota fuliginosa MF-IS2]|uniref:Uncharacterized protein n=1 Tax=Macrolepiota fuliginosa MF-IS2 TaxID=1400762 RepID=A0A9P5X3E9_9AGAR|nr:hypothetical protein P691DRAFT_506123 [Macrolepiota fuliginosa MF-IS2]